MLSDVSQVALKAPSHTKLNQMNNSNETAWTQTACLLKSSQYGLSLSLERLMMAVLGR